MKTKILKVIGTWSDVVDDCRSTVGKESLGHEPSAEFKRKILIAEHSPIRNISIKWKWEDIPSWVATHWSRHKWECFIQSQRSDRTGVDRNKLPQDAPVTFTGIANAQHLIDTWRKRLCYQSAPETREYAEDFKVTLYGYEAEISDALCPSCVAKGFCSEMKSCGYWKNFLQSLGICYGDVVLDGEERYKAYNKYFWNHPRVKGGGKPMMPFTQTGTNIELGTKKEYYFCPNCKSRLQAERFTVAGRKGNISCKDKYCSECGTKIDWSDELE